MLLSQNVFYNFNFNSYNYYSVIIIITLVIIHEGGILLLVIMISNELLKNI